MTKNHTLALLSIGASLCATMIAEAATPPPETPHPRKHLTFDQADVDHNGGLNLFEFAATQGPGTPIFQTRRLFLLIDAQTDPVDGLVTKHELKEYRALAEKPKSRLTRFQLADLDSDGELSPVELGYLVSPRVPFKSILVRFDRIDTDEDGVVTLSEFREASSDDI